MDKYLTVVNKQNPFYVDMIKDFKFVKTKDYYGSTQVEQHAFSAFKKLCKELNTKFGIALSITSANRSIAAQQKMFDEVKAKYGIDEANKRVAKPGESEHILGLAFDIGVHKCSSPLEQQLIFDNPLVTRVANKFKKVSKQEKEKMYDIIHKVMTDFGFIYRFKKEKAEFTGINMSEDWHIRYVGIEHAKAMEKMDMCLEEYVHTLENEQSLVAG